MNVVLNGIEYPIEAKEKPGSMVWAFGLEHAPEEIQQLPAGYYAVNGENFLIEKNMYENYEIKHIIFEWQSENRELYNYVEKKLIDSAPDEPEEEYDEPSCSRCGDGGCVHCEPWRFI